MKLLIDENISFRLVKLIEDKFPKTEQVKRLGLISKEDSLIWEYAKKNDFTILTFDDDYREISQVLGTPPKVILIRGGNINTKEIAFILNKNSVGIQEFIESEDFLKMGILEIYS